MKLLKYSGLIACFLLVLFLIYTFTTTQNESQIVDRTNLVLSSKDEECTKGAIERDGIGGIMWPIHELYKSYEISLGQLFTALACGEERVKELYPKGITDHGIYLEIYPGPSPDFKKTLIDIGFQFVEKGPRQMCTYPGQKFPPTNCVIADIPDTFHENWELTKSVDIQSLYPLRKYMNEKWGGDLGGLE